MLHNDTLFLTLNIFSVTGGIEKVNRIMGKAIFERSVQENKRVMIWSMHDKKNAADNNRYFPSEYYEAFAGNKPGFVKKAVQQGVKSKLVILSHINLLPVGWMIKKLSPATHLILMAHGIEIWGSLGKMKSTMLPAMDHIWAVSNFTRNKIISQHAWPAKKVSILNNCLDPYLCAHVDEAKVATLSRRYDLVSSDKILFTLTRLSAKEKYKGYDDVIRALQQLNDSRVKYILAGKADEKALAEVRQQVEASGLQGQVILPGYIADEEVAAHYKLADCFIMPSSGEGFGIAFIEAMYYGTPVIGGNSDGTLDALQCGALGQTVTPGNVGEVKDAIKLVLENVEQYRPDGKLLLGSFGYDVYKENLKVLFN